jgi:hypothetical protein
LSGLDVTPGGGGKAGVKVVAEADVVVGVAKVVVMVVEFNHSPPLGTLQNTSTKEGDVSLAFDLSALLGLYRRPFLNRSIES